jgi:hypothetical protein
VDCVMTSLYRTAAKGRWSIGIYRGRALTELGDPPGVANPVLTGRDVTDVPARSVADPFLLRRGDGWFLFMEVYNTETDRGELAYAFSDDGLRWRYEGVVLREPFHLSYPQVFECGGRVYMIPETRQDNAIRLYVAEDFPRGWELAGVLVRGYYADATVVGHEGRFWMFAQRGLDELRLFVGDRPEGPWREHPRSPLRVGDRRRSRPGGRMLRHEGRLYRFAQDGLPTYGHSLRALQVDRLDESEYDEHEIEGSPILTASRVGWNAMGMHHIDAHRLESGEWLAAVDGLGVEYNA